MNTNTDVTHQSTAAQQHYTTGVVTSKDGTTIGYRQYGHGPGIVLVQGAMGSAQNFSRLAEILSDAFTVYVPDRRGRGLSPLPYRADHTIQRDAEDVEALLVQTDTHRVFGLSSGAAIALTAAISSKTIRKLAIYEPPLFEDQPLPTAQLARFDKAFAQGNLAAALSAAGKAVKLVPFLTYMPSWLLTSLTKRIMVSEEKQPKGDYLTMRELALSLPYDMRDVSEVHGSLERWRAVQTEVLLLGGTKSPAYLRDDLGALEKVLPRARRVVFSGLGHAAAWNYDKQRNPDGKPELVAQELRRFFAES
jgi:pimeloyl-ACP methyl ester carboxylesterase